MRLPVAAALAVLALAPAARAQSRLSLLHDALHLSTAQEPAWRAFVAATRAAPEAEAQAQATARLSPTLPTPRRLALLRAQMQADLDRFDRQAQAIVAFYGALTPQQQQTFDRESAASANGRPG